MAYGDSTQVGVLTGGVYNSTDITNAIALADDLAEEICQTTWSGTTPTNVAAACSMIAARILENGIKHALQLQQREPGSTLYKIVTPEILSLLQSELTIASYSIASEDYQ